MRGSRSLATEYSDGKAVAPDGTLFAWGANSEGQMGVGTLEHDMRPQHVAVIPEAVADVSCGPTTTVACGASGQVYTWGKCEYGSLGHGEDIEDTISPALVEALRGIRITSVSAGTNHMVALSDEGEVYTWGWGGSLFGGVGGLGHGDTTDQPRPALVDALVEGGHRIVQVAAGGKHTLALTSEGLVMGWGNGSYGRLGNARSGQKVPYPVEILEDKRIVQVAAGKSYSMCVSDEGELYVFGKNDQSQLGLGANLTMDLNSMEEFPVLNDWFVKNDLRVAQVAAGPTHALAVCGDGNVYYWGARLFIEPHVMSGLEGHTVAQVAAGDGLSVVLSATGDVFSWGKGRRMGANALGHGDNKSRKFPEQISAFAGLSIAKVATGGSGAKHCAAVSGPAPQAPVTSLPMAKVADDA